MKILIKLAICTYLITLLSSCASAFDAIKTVNTSALKIGMTKAQVQEALKKKPFGTISAKKDAQTNDLIEVVEYSQHNGTQKMDSYWLYFVNDKLDRWEPASNYYMPGI